ncbi:pentatricopeptide repeat-containing protein At2g36980, mitochondrial [Amborella trichopoda]|nr:pentatricopeptide repeat-containing protein At2g36980, mitochondrial [Amborella trichopoda]|eukprot:XP_006855388.3 pentatricopeptide repeat-containing protein At2g36980, mitochondrial [Amborella trichopoda]
MTKMPLNIRNACHMFGTISRADMLSLTTMISTLVREGNVSEARRVFDQMPQRDVVSWNAMLTGYAQLGHAHEAISLFTHMRAWGPKGDGFSFTAIISACADLGSLNYGKKLHGLVVSFGFQSSLPVCNSLIYMYGKCHEPSSSFDVFNGMGVRNELSWCSVLCSYVKSSLLQIAHKIFVDMPNRGTFAWNVMISGYARVGEFNTCLRLFKEMEMVGGSPDFVTIVSLVSGCVDTLTGHAIHAHAIKSGLDLEVEVRNSILSFYAKLGSLDEAMNLFSLINVRTQVSWNAIITAHMRHASVQEALALFECAPTRNTISWTIMIAGCARNEHSGQALSLFVRMHDSGIQLDHFTLGAALHACSNLALLRKGKLIHGCVIHLGFHSYTYTGNALLNMYAKCGDIKGSHKVFEAIFCKDEVSWNAMIFGFGHHGLAQEAFMVFGEMLRGGWKPDKVTFIGLLTACSHTGLVEQGKKYYELMSANFGIEPQQEHAACMIDMLGRHGSIEEAKAFAQPRMEREAYNTCEALLGACAKHVDIGLGERVAKELISIEPGYDMGYVLLANMYCESGNWEGGEKLRHVMRERGLRKVPGCSWIEVKAQVEVFMAGDFSHPQIEEIYRTVDLLVIQMRNARIWASHVSQEHL